MSAIETISTLNSAVRTLIALVLLVGIGVAGWFGYTTYYGEKFELQNVQKTLNQAQEELAGTKEKLQLQEQRVQELDQEILTKNNQLAEQQLEISALEQDVQEKTIEIERLDTSLRLLKLDHRLARLTVLDVGTDDEENPFSEIQFVELNESGDPIGEPRTFRLEGDMVYIDYWVVKFEDKYIEEADLDRSTSICLFRRIFGEFRKPKEGYVLDEPGSRPKSYAQGGKISDFEKKIWDDFWNIANDEDRAAELGIRAAHGEAVSIKVQKGKSYKLQLRASDGLSITPETNAPAPVRPAA